MLGQKTSLTYIRTSIEIEHKNYFWFAKTLSKAHYVGKSQGPMKNIYTSTLG